MLGLGPEVDCSVQSASDIHIGRTAIFFFFDRKIVASDIPRMRPSFEL
jgi:hypothetical protein